MKQQKAAQSEKISEKQEQKLPIQDPSLKEFQRDEEDQIQQEIAERIYYWLDTLQNKKNMLSKQEVRKAIPDLLHSINKFELWQQEEKNFDQWYYKVDIKKKDNIVIEDIKLFLSKKENEDILNEFKYQYGYQNTFIGGLAQITFYAGLVGAATTCNAF